jgi:prepilin-type N-terminal cleavage/methylation domain-containing protein
MHRPNFSRPQRIGAAGFTLIELLVVIAIIAILAGILLPALSRAKEQSLGIYCENNVRQVQMAWLMYAHDSNDTVAVNNWQDEQAHTKGANGLAINWISGWEELGDPNTADNTNTDLIMNSVYSQLGTYLKNPKSYQCAASRSLCKEANGDYPLCRDISMNGFMGYNCDGQTGYQSFAKLSRIAGTDTITRQPFGPAQALVLIDEKDNSIDDGEFLVEMGATAEDLANMPAAYHSGAGLAGFADGHAEIHKWLTPQVLLPAQFGGVVVWGSTFIKDQFKTCTANNPDLLWLQARASFAVE